MSILICAEEHQEKWASAVASSLGNTDIKLALSLPVISAFLLSLNLYLSSIAWNEWICQIKLYFLVRPGDNLMQSKFGAADQLLLRQILQLLHIIGVINIDLEILRFLKLIIDLDCGNEFRIQVI